jgi:hypothetical protein
MSNMLRSLKNKELSYDELNTSVPFITPVSMAALSRTKSVLARAMLEIFPAQAHHKRNTL